MVSNNTKNCDFTFTKINQRCLMKYLFITNNVTKRRLSSTKKKERRLRIVRYIVLVGGGFGVVTFFSYRALF